MREALLFLIVVAMAATGLWLGLRRRLNDANDLKRDRPDVARATTCSLATRPGASPSTSPRSRSCRGEANLAFKPKAFAATLAA
jgi:hypothetical protein